MKKKVKNKLYSIVFLMLSANFFSQDTLVKMKAEKEYAEDIFTGLKIINSQTTKMQYSNSWFFEIQHRFGKIGMDSSLVQQFLGFDLPSTIRFAMGRSFSDRMYVSVGRCNYLKTVDLESKYLLMKQTKDFKMPVSVALYFNASARTEKFPNVPKNAFFEDTVTSFVYKSSHRMAYNSQIIISSKLSDKLTLQLTPVFVYQNLVPIGYENYTFSLSGGGRYKFGMSSSLIFEYSHVFNNRLNKFNDPLSLGVEFGTAGHIFQLFFSTSTRILESHVYTTSGTNISAGEFLVGFNIQRNFFKKNKN